MLKSSFRRFTWVMVLIFIFPFLNTSTISAESTYEAHEIRTDAQGHIAPWYSLNIGASYDHCLNLLWNWWKKAPLQSENGQPVYMQHCCWPQRYNPAPMMASGMMSTGIDSWKLYYVYTGDPSVLSNAEYLANFGIDNGLSDPSALWPNLLYPCNTVEHPASRNGFLDGAMYKGVGVTMPHEAGAFANQLVDLYKITGKSKYLDYAIAAANTLVARRNANANEDYSPWPFLVNVNTGVIPDNDTHRYTTAFTPILELFTKLLDMGTGNTSAYSTARNAVISWLKSYPLSNNKWGPWFEDDAATDSYNHNTGTNADEMARWILQNPTLWGASYIADANSILTWTINTLGLPNHKGINWLNYGTVPICEEDVELSADFAGQSHTSRHYAVRLLLDEKTGTKTWNDKAIHGLNWATYTVTDSGVNYYPQTGGENWTTDGYTDYVKHYLWAMASLPELSNREANHILRSSSLVRTVRYSTNSVQYLTYDTNSTEVLRLNFHVTGVTAGGNALTRLINISDLNTSQGYTFNASGDASGVLRIRHTNSGSIVINGSDG